MALPVTIPNEFANATASIPLSQLDANFNTLANAVNGISDGSETLANVTATVGNITTVNATTVDTTNIEVTNIKAKDGTAAGSIADSTGVVTLASSVLTTTDINGGTIDGTAIGGASAAAVSATTLNTSGAVVFNDAGADVDFRVESDTVENALFVEGSSGNVGIGTSSPGAVLDIQRSSPTTYFRGNASDGSRPLTITSSTTSNNGDTHTLNATSISGVLAFATANTERARIDSSGNLLVGTTGGSNHRIVNGAAQGSPILQSYSTGTGLVSFTVLAVSTEGYSTANAGIWVGKNSSTSRSINAGGTVNASGADYAEYMTKAGEFKLAKGDVCGVNADGKLTNIFADAVAFVVKSTNPSYVGGDTWGTEETIGNKPEKPTQRAAEVDEKGNETQAAETDEDFAARQAQYETDLAEFEAKLEAERQKVDRIAFSGQVPVNVTGATAGQYIVPVESNGGITGVAVNEADMTLAQYIKAVGKVIAIEADGRARIIVKVA